MSTPIYDSTKHRVVCAAMLMDDGLVVTGVRHLSPDMRATMKRIYGDGYHLRIEEQGFIDSHGTFLTRGEAWARADANGQIFLYDPATTGARIKRGARRKDQGTLFSENLY